MKKFKILTMMLVFAIFIILNITISNAASLTIKSSKSTAKKGDTVKITITGNGISGKVDLSVSGNGSLSQNSVWVENSSITVKLKINGSGNITVTAKPKDVSDSNTADPFTKSASTVIEVKGDDRSDNSTTTKSTDATLRNLGIKPNDFSGFKKTTTSYSVSVPKNVEKISIYATPTNEKATISGTGSKTLKIGKNTFNVKVTAEDKKTTKTYTLVITRKAVDENLSDATLSNLGIRPKEYDFTGFKSNVTEYKVDVPNKVEKINIYATATNSNAAISGVGEKTLKEGENEFSIKVTSADKKTTKTYKMIITRKEEDDEQEEILDTETSITGIKDIKIEGLDLNPEFSQQVYEYKVNVPEMKEKLNIQVETEQGIEVEIVGNENLKVGENIITILVRDTKTDATTIYQINANIQEQEQEEKDITKIDVSQENSEINQVQNNLKKRDWILKFVILLIIILTVVFLIKKYKSTKENFEDDFEEETEEENEEEKISETKKFYDEMEQDKMQNNEVYETEEITRKRGRYKGKRFK